MQRHFRYLVFGLLLANADVALAQTSVTKNEFRSVQSQSVITEHGFNADFAALKENDQIYVPPMFRYRLTLKTKGVIRPISEHRRKALVRWAISNKQQNFIALFTHEIQVAEGTKTFWLPWQRTLAAPFEEEMRKGGSLSVKVLFIGAIANEVLFLAIGYQAL